MEETIFNETKIAKLNEKLRPLLQNLNKFNAKTTDTATTNDLNKVMKCVTGPIMMEHMSAIMELGH